jgi:hypothetical protein
LSGTAPGFSLRIPVTCRFSPVFCDECLLGLDIHRELDYFLGNFFGTAFVSRAF